MLLNKPIPLRFYLRPIRQEALFIFLFANAVVLAKHFLGLRYLTLPLTIPTLLGTCIALLLAFRTSQAYDRWWEARTVWGAIVNDSRSLIRQLQQFLPEGDHKNDLLHAFVDRHCAWCYGLGDSLRGVELSGRLSQFLPSVDVPLIVGSDNPPNALLLRHGLVIGQLYAQGQLTDYQQVHLSATLNSLTDSMGRCERIKNTVFPRTYTFNLQVFIYLFAAMLPFCLEAELYYLDVPLVTMIASGFMLIEKSALQLQDPLGSKPTDMPMTSLARTIEINLKTMTKYESIPPPLATQGYYAL